MYALRTNDPTRFAFPEWKSIAQLLSEPTEGLAEMVLKLEPKTIVVYGSAPDSIFEKYKENGIRILQFDSEIAAYHKAVNA